VPLAPAAPAPTVVAVTGASGAGKTTLVRALARERLPGVGCYEFDSVGVPTLDEMAARHGGPERWQRDTTTAWMRRLAANADGVRAAVLDGQVRLTFLRDAFAAAGVTSGHIVLVDCAPEVRRARLGGARGQPELATPEMDAWAAYLRGQADALGVPVLDTTHDAPAASAGRLRALVTALLR
jgi:ABC-type nitrate/sulfonate/bicarbonate transport system substrate-binding protein